MELNLKGINSRSQWLGDGINFSLLQLKPIDQAERFFQRIGGDRRFFL